MPSTNNGSLNCSTYGSLKRTPGGHFGNQFRNAMQESAKFSSDPVATNMRELKDKMAEMNNLKAAVTTETKTKSSSSRFSRSVSAAGGMGLKMPSPQITELGSAGPVSSSPTDSLDEGFMVGSGGGGGSNPIVTSPAPESVELNFSDQEHGQ